MRSNEVDGADHDGGEQLHAAFVRAAEAIERSSVDFRRSDVATDAADHHDAIDVHVLRSMVRGAAADYARRLRAEGVTPERMLVLVKATTDTAGPGLGVRDLTNDIVRWSIEAYFDD